MSKQQSILQFLGQFLPDLSYIDSYEDLQESATSMLAYWAQADYVTFFLVKPGEQGLSVVYSKGLTKHQLGELVASDVESYPNWVVANKRVVNQPVTEDFDRSYQTGSRLSIPVISQGSGVGAITLEAKGNEQFDENDQQVLTLLANVMGGVYKNIVCKNSYNSIEEGLLKAEDALVSMYDYAYDGIIEFDQSGAILSINPAASQLLKFGEQQYLNQPVEDLIQHHQLSAPIATSIADYLSKGGGELVNRRHEFTLKRGDSTLVDVIGTVLTDFSGGGIKFKLLLLNISRQKTASIEYERANYQLSHLFKSLHAGVLVEDSEGKISMINQAFCDLFNIPVPPESLKGYSCSKAANDSKRLFVEPDAFVHRIKELTDQNEAARNEVLNLLDGRVFERDFSPIIVEEEVVGYMWEYRDITEAVLNAAMLEQAKREAEEANRAEEAFLAGMSHEFRTPLNGVLGMANLLADTPLDEEQQDYLDALVTSGRSLVSLVGDLLDYSKIEKTQYLLKMQPFDMVQLLKDVETTLIPTEVDRYNVLLKGIYPSNGQLVVGDPDKLGQFFTELFTRVLNQASISSFQVSMKYDSQPNEAVNCLIRCSWLEGNSENEWLSQLITMYDDDNGEGTMAKAFIAMKEKYKLQLSAGESNDPDSSLQVSLLLDGFRKAEEEGAVVKQQLSVAGMRVLLADDNVINRKLVVKLLRAKEVLVDEATNGVEAVELFKKGKYQLILMDIQMPLMDGFEATANIRSEGSDIPIIALTASIAPGMEKKLVSLGFSDYLLKPFDVESFFQKISLYMQADADEAVNEEEWKHAKLDFLEQNADGDVVFMIKMIELLEHEIPAQLESIREAITKEETALLAGYLHKLKPSIKLMGADDVFDELELMEKEIKENKPIKTLEERLSNAEKNIYLALGELQKWGALNKK